MNRKIKLELNSAKGKPPITLELEAHGNGQYMATLRGFEIYIVSGPEGTTWSVGGPTTDLTSAVECAVTAAETLADQVGFEGEEEVEA